ncbi:ABC transporter permease [Streptomyces sp. RB6PN25]|uniref:ABC transporter permease n=1 Tax=Streptomyces humicola TaxID=2953240 RepID=A0ABT1PX06_9ACTN|nr:ABC transporter permease [Streptomyces humicola]MCQ4082204.1 ABC transporter permease [Streptomyces humicola]
MFFTYLRRELRRRRKAALVIALGLALGIGLVITVQSVSAGMSQAQGKVLQSLYGLGTDMTVTKAPPADTGSGASGPPSFKFNASSGSSSQSDDRIMPQGFQTLDDSVVSKVQGQSGVAEAVGGLSLRVVKINGQFSQGQIAQQPDGSGGGGGGAGALGGGGGGGGGGRGYYRQFIKGGGANFNVDNYTLYGVDTSKMDIGPLTASKITSGRNFTSSDASQQVVVVDSNYASQKKLSVGSTFTISGKNYKVIGIATADSGDAAANVYVPLQQAQTLANTKNEITTVYVKATNSQLIGNVKSEVQKNISGTTVTTSQDLASTVGGSLSTASSLASTVGKWLSIVVLIAAFLVAGLLTSSAVSRRVREFGTLKALGWKSRRVTGQVVGEALVNGLIGGVLGIGIGLGAAYLITAISPNLTAQLGGGGGGGNPFGGGGGGGGLGGGGGVVRRAAGKSLHIALTAPVSVSTIVLAVALAIAGGLIAGGFGGWRASRLRPADALRRVE